MATTVDLPYTRAQWHEKTDLDWSTARNSIDSDSVTNTTPARIGIAKVEGYIFYRLYLSFDLSILEIPEGSTINEIILSLQRTDRIRGQYDPIIAYAGDEIITRIDKNYPLYINNTTGGIPLSKINLKDDTRYWQSLKFNLNTYPVNINDILTIGIVDTYDFDDSIDAFSDAYEIDLDVESSPPYLTITYTEGGGGGYPNTVMGIPSANISTVMGVPTANISKVMGV
jgi:hypothetical protein